METSNKEHLEFIYYRLKHVYKESPNYDYMIRLKLIIDEMSNGRKKDK